MIYQLFCFYIYCIGEKVGCISLGGEMSSGGEFYVTNF